MRTLNARMWGDARNRSADGRDPVKLGGCGRVFEGGHLVPIFAVDGRWRPAGVASCDNALLCDQCGPRVQAESAARFKIQFEDWLAGGGRLVNIRLSVPHSMGDDLAPLLKALRVNFTALRRSAAWRGAGVVDWVRVRHVRDHPVNGWHPHYHVTAFVSPTAEFNIEQFERSLQLAWRDQLVRAGFKRTSKRNGLFARVATSGLRALYAWSWADRDEPEPDDGDDYEPSHASELDADYEPRYDPDYRPQSVALWELAQRALDGDARAWARWSELCRALKGERTVACSRLLDQVWKFYLEQHPQPEPVVIDADPVVVVDARLWERARRAGVTQMGLTVGAELGDGALAQFWARELSLTVELRRVRDGPPVLVSPDLVGSF